MDHIKVDSSDLVNVGNFKQVIVFEVLILTLDSRQEMKLEIIRSFILCPQKVYMFKRPIKDNA